MSKIFQIFDRYRTSIDVVTTSVTSVSATVEKEKHLPRIVKELQKLGEVTVLGNHKIPVEMISLEASNASITFVVAEKHANKTLQVLHKTYIEA